MGVHLYFDNYSPVGDLTVVAMCMAIVVILLASYVGKTSLSRIYITIVAYLAMAALSDVIYHTLYTKVTNGDYSLILALRVVYHALLFSVLLLYVVYIVKLINLGGRRKRLTMIVSTIIYLGVITTDIVTCVTGTGFRLDKSGKAISGYNVFMLGHILLVSVIVVLMVRFRKVLYRRVTIGFYGTVSISLLILFMQGRHGQSSFTVVSFLFPTVAMLVLVHASAYDLASGAANTRAMEDTISNCVEKKINFLFVSLFLPDYNTEGKALPREVLETIRHMGNRLFKGVQLYQVSNGHMIYIARKRGNPDYRERAREVVGFARDALAQHKVNYKIVMGESIDEISRKKAYIEFLKNIHRQLPLNDVHVVDEKDVTGYNEYVHILTELADIAEKKDPADERVRVYCQPVWSIRTNSYDTAETLMRLELPKLGLIAPFKFIPLAEEGGYIHALTEIILKKACDGVRELLQEGFVFKRVSVNLSIEDLRADDFIEHTVKIIGDSGIPYEKVAFEVTESLNEYDFDLIKKRINELKERGIKFYLDDFGTGFSNMERILELPFDIIKFDRSLVLACDLNERSQKMVGTLAGMFADFDYAVLYEGVESEKDEARCRSMSASYLQGFKYSRPIPFEELRKYFRTA